MKKSGPLRLLKKFSFVIGLVIFAYIVQKLNFSYYKELLPNINFSYLIVGLSLSPVLIFIKSYRWKKIMDVQNIHYSVKNAFLIYGVGLFFGLVTPGRLGELSKILYLKADGHKVSSSSLNNILDRISDLLFMFIFGFVGMFFLPYSLVGMLSKNFIIFIILLFLAAGIIVSLIFSKQNGYLKNFLKEIISDLKLFRLKNWSLIIFITVFSWIVYFFIIYLLAMSLNLHQKISFFYLAFISVANALIAILPISILGLGTREATLLFLFAPFNLADELVIAFSMFILLIYLPVAIIGFISWLKITPSAPVP